MMEKKIRIKIPEAMLRKALGRCRRIRLRGQGIIAWRLSPVRDGVVEVETYVVTYGAGKAVPEWSEEKGGWVTYYFYTPNPFLARRDILPFYYEGAEDGLVEYEIT